MFTGLWRIIPPGATVSKNNPFFLCFQSLSIPSFFYLDEQFPWLIFIQLSAGTCGTGLAHKGRQWGSVRRERESFKNTIMRNILVLCDNPGMVSAITAAVSQHAMVIQASDLPSGEGLHNQHPFDHVIVDMGLLTPQLLAQGFEQVIKPFVRTNPLVKFIAMTSREEVRQAVKAVKDGASDYITYPFEPRELGLVLDEINETLGRDLELDYLRDRFWKTEWLEIVQSHNTGMRRVYDSIRSVAPTIATVLILGDTGTGKGLFSRLIHWHSLRYDKPFIDVHCGAIPDTLLESELFGHEKGAFTGADRRKPGKFEMARGGTIFLDEIGTITPAAQIKLLQVLQDGTFSRVGGDQVMTADVRIIAATNADLSLLVAQGQFRKDLYYRLNIFPIEIPPLKARLEDLPYIVELLLTRLNAKYGKGIPKLHPDVREGFIAYDWPGNIRELENILERAYILETGPILTPCNFPPDLVKDSGKSVPPLTARGDLPLAEARQAAIHAFESAYVKDLLRQTRGKINQAAEKAGITPRQLNRLIVRYHIDKLDFKPDRPPHA